MASLEQVCCLDIFLFPVLQGNLCSTRSHLSQTAKKLPHRHIFNKLTLFQRISTLSFSPWVLSTHPNFVPHLLDTMTLAIIILGLFGDQNLQHNKAYKK